MLSSCLVAWLLFQAFSQRDVSLFQNWGAGQWAAATVAAFLYTATLVAASLVWWLLLRAVGCQGAPFLQTSSVPLLSQVGKYLPGNLAHHLGRLLLSRLVGLDLQRTTFAILIETLWSVGIALALSALALSPLEHRPTGVLGGWTAGTLIAFALAAALAPALLRHVLLGATSHWLRKQRINLSELTLPSLGISVVSVATYLLGYLTLGMVIDLIARAVFDAAAINWLLLAGAYAAAWIAGFVTPGSPAGLGVRDFVLVTLLTPFYGEGFAMSITILLRLVTVAGDGIAYLVGLAAWKLSRTAELSIQKDAR